MTLIFGKSGQVASSLKRLLPPQHALFVGADECNFANLDLIAPLLDRVQPKDIIVCSAYTQVDKAETERDLAEKINHFSLEKIGSWAAKNNARVVSYSTDYVYPGEGEAAQSEESPTQPANWYGETKLRGETALLKSCPRTVILRTSWVYSEYGHNFVKTMLKLARDRSELNIVADQVGAPTYAEDLAKATLQILGAWTSDQDTSGVYNCAGGGSTSWFFFANAIFEKWRILGHTLAIQNVHPIASERYPTPAKRPKNSRLNQTKLLRKFDIRLPNWDQSLETCLRRLHENSDV